MKAGKVSDIPPEFLIFIGKSDKVWLLNFIQIYLRQQTYQSSVKKSKSVDCLTPRKTYILKTIGPKLLQEIIIE